MPSQNRCSAWETNSGPLSIRSTFGGPPAAANTASSSATSRSAVIERSTRCSSEHAGVLVDHRRDLDRLAVDGGVELEIDRPHHVRGIGVDRRDRGHPGPFPRTMHPHLQALLAPQAVDLLLVHLTALVVAQRRPGTPEPMARMFGRVGAQPGPHLGVGIGRGLRQWQAPVGGAGQPNRLARQPFRHAQTVSVSMSTARRLAAGLRIFPWPPPAARPFPVRPRPTAASAGRSARAAP